MDVFTFQQYHSGHTSFPDLLNMLSPDIEHAQSLAHADSSHHTPIISHYYPLHYLQAMIGSPLLNEHSGLGLIETCG